MSDIAVSISCLTFNHEKYVRKTFDGILAQKTNFKFEVLVHDDASTDGTQDIIREYEEKYPDIFKPIYQKENQYSKGTRISMTYIFPRIQGKYLAYCEGDDYWMDENKLQKQYDLMEAHPECSMCTHIVNMISEDESSILGQIPKNPFKEGVVSEEEFLRKELIEGWASQTTSFFIRSQLIKDYTEEYPLFMRELKVGDFPTVLYMITRGKVYFMHEVMSCYRIGAQSSYRERRKRDSFISLRHFYSQLIAIEEYNRYTQKKYDQIIKTFQCIKMEQVQKLEKELMKEYEGAFLKEIYGRGPLSVRQRISYFVRKNTPHFYHFMVYLYEKFANR